jgi:glutamyl-Q tRNA(Asp) synthetase
MHQPVVTRFAPSPSGGLHLGHAYAAHFACDAARAAGGRFILRIEDIDITRCKPEFAAQILDDLSWLGLQWETPVRRQSDHWDDYRDALERLDRMGVIYPCFCTRQDIAHEIEQSGRAPHGPASGPEGLIYPGICRHLTESERRQKLMTSGNVYSLRLDVAKAIETVGEPLYWHDRAQGKTLAQPQDLGDVVLARREVPASYHLAVTLDDHCQGVTRVTRGADLFHATHIHRLLQALLGLDVPEYHHHPLLTDATGKRLAKRDRALTLAALRHEGKTPADIREMIEKFAANAAKLPVQPYN